MLNCMRCGTKVMRIAIKNRGNYLALAAPYDIATWRSFLQQLELKNPVNKTNNKGAMKKLFLENHLGLIRGSLLLPSLQQNDCRGLPGAAKVAHADQYGWE